MNAKTLKPMSLSDRKRIVLQARRIADYTQGTMGLENQGLKRSEYRKLKKRIYQRLINQSVSVQL